MKTIFKRASKSTLAVVLTLCLLFSCMTVGIMSTSAASVDYVDDWTQQAQKDVAAGAQAVYDASVGASAGESVGAISSHFYLIGNLTGDNWNSNQTNYKIDTSYGSDGKFYIEVTGVQNAWFALWNGSSRYAPSSSCEASSSNPNAASGDYDHSGNSWQYKGTASTIKICIDETVGTRTDKEWYPAVWVEEVASTTPLAAPTISYNSSTKKITWSSVSNASSYDVYKDGSLYAANKTSPYTVSTTGKYTVVAKPASGSTTYSQSPQSNEVEATINLTFYVCNSDDWTNIYYHVYVGGTSYAAWPGTKITSTQIGTITGTGYTEKPVYEVSVPDNFTHIILHNNNGIQYKGDSKVALTANKLYFTTSTNQEANPSTIADFNPATMLDAIKYDVTFTPSPAGGTVKVNDSSTSPVKVAENTNFTILAKPNTGYTVNTVKVGTTTLTAQSGGNDTNGYTYTSNVGTAAKTVTVTFKARTYTVTLNKNADDATAGTASVTATYDSDMPSATMPTRTGYTFEGYYDTSNATGGTKYYTAAGASARTWNKTSATTLYARWSEVTGGAVAKAYTNGSASDTGGTVKIGNDGTAGATANLTAIGITSANTVIATKKSYYDFTGWQFSGNNCTHLRYRFATSGEWLTPTAGTTYGTASNTTIYIKTDGTSGITTSNAEVHALFVPTTYSYTTNAYYSTTGADDSYTNTLSATVTPASGSTTNPTGVNVTAPATVTVSGVKYNFVDFVATSGSVTTVATSGTNKTTTFKPTAANAVCTARYKKVFTITSSVDNTGTGAGTVSTSVTEVEAGGSYTITATAKSGSAIESVKVNGTAKTATASQTISSVSADQTVVAKFKSNVYLRGESTIGTNWTTGDAMTSNADGTEFTKSYENVAGASGGTQYQFKLYVGDYNNDGSAAINITGGASTGTCTHQSDGNKNYVLTLKKAANVTVKSDGTKITEIKVVPANSTKYAVTFKKADNTTITGQYEGTNFTTASADATVQVYEGDEISFTVTADTDKYLSGVTTSSGTLSPAFNATTHAAEYEGSVTVTAATTITPAVANKLKVTCTTNKTEWGTVSVDPVFVRPGETVTITYTAASGTLKKLTVYSAGTSTVIKEWTRDANGDMVISTAQQNNVSLVFGKLRELVKVKAGESVGAGDDPLTFTMPSGNVSITATYEEYVGTSDYFYNGRNTSGQSVNGYGHQVMSEGVIGGQKYAYYNVTGREGVGYDQLFYISKGGSYDGRWVYFDDKGGTYADWASHDPTAYFYNSSGAVGDAWPGKAMTWVSGQGSNVDKHWKLEIPAGATGVIFTNGKSGGDFKQTHDINLTNTNGSYYPSGYSSNKYEVTQWSTPGENSGIIAGTDYYWDTDVYKDQWYTGGFSNHNVNNVNNFAKPKDGNGQTFGDTKGDYYIVVLYPNTSYTFNLPGHTAETKTVGAKPMVLWMPTLPGQEAVASSYVKVYAKDGAIRRDGDDPERNNMTYSTFEHHANTFVYGDSGYANHIGTRSSHDGQSSEGTGYDGYTYDYIQKFEKGETLYIKTNLKNDTYMNRYYLYAYSINGKCYQIHTVAESQTGSVTEAFTVPEDWEYDYVEITPIYFLRDSSNAITFYVEGYDEEVMHAGWGNTPYVYPFYQDANFNYVTNVNNPFGGYPGQPLVFYQGNYYTQLPKNFSAIPESGGTATSCTIKGVTLGNGYWDDIHVLTKEVKSHFQTYDYDDLYKIVTEYPDYANHVICSFKYRTKKNNDEPGNNPNFANYNKTNGNGWEVLTDYYGRPVDIFGTLLTGTALTTAQDMITNKTADSATTGVVHAISQDYKSNSAGDYATEWAIYDTEGAKVTGGNKTTIVPSALALTDTSRFQYYDSATRAFQGIYDALKAKTTTVVGQPVVVTYEKSIYGGGDKADRCDARWYYSKTGESISATTRIEYTDDGKNWVTDTYNANTGTGSHTGTQAYFTGKIPSTGTASDTPSDTTGINGKNTTSISGTTGGGYYTFNAENAGQYEFVGWYLLRDNYQNISVRSSYDAGVTTFASHAEQSKNGDIFVARFKKTATGTLDIFHEVHPQTSGYGHVYVEAVVQDAGGTQQGSKIGSISGGTLTDHIQIPSTYIRSGEGYKVVATFKAEAYPTSHFDDFYATIGELLSEYDGYGFIVGKQFDEANGTATITYDVDKLFSVASGSPVQTVTSITHYSKFSLRDDLTYNLEYKFTTRYYGDKLYKYTNKAFTAEELRSYFRSQIEDPNDNVINIDEQFVQSKAPFESNYREDLTWVIDNVKIVNNVGKLTATQVPIKWAKATVYDFQDNGSMKTTTMEAPFEKLFDKTVESKPTDASEATTAITNWDTTCTDDDLYTTIRTSYNDGNTTVPLYLHHWEVYQLDSFTYKTNSDGSPKMKEDGFNLDIDTGKSKLVCLTYSTKFNYIGYEDYAIVPVYTTDLMSTPERQAISDSRTDSSATLLTITRNHWNTNVAGNTQGGKYVDSADRIYVDFMLNYNYKHNNQNILLSTTGDNIKVGFIVKSYTIDYSGGTGVKVYSGKSNVYVFTNEEKATIDNKNRIEYCFGFKNTQNNSRYGLNFEFTPFIIDTNQEGAGQSITLPNNGGTYNSLYADSTVSVLDGVNFYRIGNYDPISWTEES